VSTFVWRCLYSLNSSIKIDFTRQICWVQCLLTQRLVRGYKFSPYLVCDGVREKFQQIAGLRIKYPGTGGVGCSIIHHVCNSLHCALCCGTVYCNRPLSVANGRCGSVTRITRSCVHRSSPNWIVGNGSDHLQLIRFWPSRAPREGGLRRGENVIVIHTR